MRPKLLYTGMKHDYGDKARGLSFEHRNFFYPLLSYCKKNGYDLVHYDFMERGQQIGLDLMTQELYEYAKKEQPTLLFAVLFDFHRDPRHEVFKHISQLGVNTIHWFCDDHWRFEKYSSVVAPHFDVVCTTANSALPKYKTLGISHKVIKTQWACNHELYIPYYIQKDINVSFVGQPHGNRPEVLAKVIQSGLSVEIFGYGWEGRPRLPFHQMVRLFSRSKINLNLSNSSTLIGQQIKGRNFEIPGTGSFQLAGDADNLTEYYEDGKEIAVFHSLEELIDKAKYYLNKEKERTKIAYNGYRRTLAEHTWHHRFDKIFSNIKPNIIAKRNTNASAPMVSVIIPCYNQANFLPEAVESVVKQTFTDWECIIVNDGSKDNTNEVSRELITKYSNKRIRLLAKENGGLSSARNEGIAHASGKYILPLDADDLIFPEMLQRTVSLLEAHPEIAIAYTDLLHFGSGNQLVRAGEYNFGQLCLQNHLNYCSLYRRNVWENVGGYNTNMIWGYEDWDFWISCGERGFFGVRIPEPLLKYRVKESSMYTKALEHHDELVAQIILNHPAHYDPVSINKAKKILGKHSKNKLKSSPLVSVIVPTYNRPDMLAETIKSILNQTYPNYEIIVVNDAGEDVEQLISSLNTVGKITYVRHAVNMGLAASRNTGIKKARGKYIAYLDDDDRFYANHLETLVEFLETSDYKIAYTDAYRAHQTNRNGKYVITKKDVPYSQDFDYDRILVGNFVPVLCFMHEKRCIDEVGLFDESLTTHEDWDLWIRLSRKFKCAHIKKITCEFVWRTDDTTMSSGKRADFLRTLKIIYEKYKDYVKDNAFLLDAQAKAAENLEREIVNSTHKNVIRKKVHAENKCTIVIPVFNKVEFTKKCLESLFSNTDYENYEVVVVDNASSDGTQEFLSQVSKQYQNLSVITNKTNLGFAKACNQGIKSTTGEYVLLLNNDTVIPKPDWLRNMINEAESDPKIAIVGACLLYPENDLIQHVGVVLGVYGNSLTPFHKYKLRRYNRVPQAMASRDYKIVTGACMLIRREITNEIGLLDEGYINSYEDVDFCLKAITAGYRVRYCHNSLIYHYESMSPNRHDYDQVNLKRLNARWKGKVQADENSANVRDSDLWDMWMREELQKDPDNVVFTLRLMQICKMRGDNDELAELENRLEDICRRRYHTPILTSIIIPTFNNLQLTRQCLEAIRNNTAAGRYEIIIVDNASTDGTQDFIKQAREYPNLRIIENSDNLRFAKACNQGAKIARGRYILFLNNDTLPHQGWLNLMLQLAEEKESNGIIGSKLLYPDGTVQHAGIVVGLKDGEPHPYHVYLCQPANAPFVNKVREFQMVTGACLMIRHELFDRVGGFDEAYINGHEDLDLCLRVRQAGYKVLYCPFSVVTHFEARTKRLMGLENFHYKKGVDNEEGKGRRRFLEKWRDIIKIDDHEYYKEDGLIRQQQSATKSFSKSGNSLNILFTMYGWNESGGGTTFPKSLAKELVKRGHRVSVFYASLKTDNSKPAYSILKESDDGVHLYGLYNRPALFIDPDNPEREIHDERVVTKFREVMDETRPDIVHFHNFHGLTFAMAKETKERGIPACYTPHNYHMIDPNLYLFNNDLSLWQGVDLLNNSEAVKKNPDKKKWYVERVNTTRALLNEWLDITLAVSSRQKELLVQHGATPERIAIVHQASKSTDMLWNNPHLEQEGTRPLHAPMRIGFVGGVMPHKGAHMLVAAAQSFKPLEIEIRIYGFVGKSYLLQLRALDKKNMVKFHGEYKQEHLDRIAQELDIAVVPSVWEDCAPLVLLELLAMRLPVIAADIGGIPDFIQDEVNGFLYKHDSINSIKKIISYCIENPEKIQTMRAGMRQTHSLSRYMDHLEGIYENLSNKNVSEAQNYNLIFKSENASKKCAMPSRRIPAPTTSSTIGYKKLARNNYEKGDYIQAVSYCESAMLTDPCDVDTLVLLSKCYQKMGAYDSALIGFQKALELSPKHMDAKNGMALLRQKSKTKRKSQPRPAKEESVQSCGIVWEGSQFVYHSLALINRELCLNLLNKGYDVSIIPCEPDQFRPSRDNPFYKIVERVHKPLSKVGIHVRHQWPPNFNPPQSGHWVNIQPWEYGSLPKAWIEPMQNMIDELWVPSNYARKCYTDSGINPEKVFVIPNGVNVDTFNPDVKPLDLNTKKSFKFLFVGGTIWRKGIDILLDAYVRAFKRNDDVCLVIKDMGRNSFYKGQDASRVITAIQSTPNAPEILYITEDIPAEEIAGLYTACDCLVHPYRGEGFGLPVAEAMACGLPVVVTKGGATDDFCTTETAYQIPANIVRFNKDEYVGQGWILDPNRVALFKQMKYILGNKDAARHKGLNASKYIQKNLTWKKATERIIERFGAMRDKPILRYSVIKNTV